MFFVLSGFVLTRRFLLEGDHQIILRGAIKRWPRLAGPALAAALTSWCLFKLGAYRFKEGGAITGSEWLSFFAYGIQGVSSPASGMRSVKVSFSPSSAAKPITTAIFGRCGPS